MHLLHGVGVKNNLKCIMYVTVFGHIANCILEFYLTVYCDLTCQIHVFDKDFFHCHIFFLCDFLHDRFELLQLERNSRFCGSKSFNTWSAYSLMRSNRFLSSFVITFVFLSCILIQRNCSKINNRTGIIYF